MNAARVRLLFPEQAILRTVDLHLCQLQGDRSIGTLGAVHPGVAPLSPPLQHPEVAAELAPHPLARPLLAVHPDSLRHVERGRLAIVNLDAGLERARTACDSPARFDRCLFDLNCRPDRQFGRGLSGELGNERDSQEVHSTIPPSQFSR